MTKLDKEQDAHKKSVSLQSLRSSMQVPAPNTIPKKGPKPVAYFPCEVMKPDLEEKEEAKTAMKPTANQKTPE